MEQHCPDLTRDPGTSALSCRDWILERVSKTLSIGLQAHRTTGRHQRSLVPNTHTHTHDLRAWGNQDALLASSVLSRWAPPPRPSRFSLLLCASTTCTPLQGTVELTCGSVGLEDSGIPLSLSPVGTEPQGVGESRSSQCVPCVWDHRLRECSRHSPSVPSHWVPPPRPSGFKAHSLCFPNMLRTSGRGN